MITTDGQRVIEYLNPVAEDLTGWRVEDAQGRHIDDIFRGFHEETCEPMENPLSVAIRRSRAIKSVRPLLLIKRDGRDVHRPHGGADPRRIGRGLGRGWCSTTPGAASDPQALASRAMTCCRA